MVWVMHSTGTGIHIVQKYGTSNVYTPPLSVSSSTHSVMVWVCTPDSLDCECITVVLQKHVSGCQKGFEGVVTWRHLQWSGGGGATDNITDLVNQLQDWCNFHTARDSSSIQSRNLDLACWARPAIVYEDIFNIWKRTLFIDFFF